MKRIFFIILLLSILIANSCKKTALTGRAGSWTFESVTYDADTCLPFSDVNGVLDVLTALNRPLLQNGPGLSLVACQFYDTLPVAPGTYTVINGKAVIASANQVIIQGLFHTALGSGYMSTGGNGRNQFITVTVVNGKMSAAGSSIEMVNTAAPYDSSSLTFSIRQL